MFSHVDADAFFASVLQRKHPTLRGKPILALGMGGGCVIAASYEAKAKGVKTGMRLSEALLLCPEALKVESDFRETGLASDQIAAILLESCPIIEQMSVDEWYLDLATLVGGDPADALAWATDLQARIRRQTGLSVSAGIGPSKLLAKMAGEYHKPAGVTAVGVPAPGALGIEEFLRDRPAQAIPGIGPRRMTHASAHGWETAWDIAVAPADTVLHLYGRPGRDMQRELLGKALSSVKPDDSPQKSISRARSFRHLRDHSALWAHTVEHLQYTILKMRRMGRACSGLSLWLRDGEYRYDSRHVSLPQPMDTEAMLTPYARRCFRSLCERGQAYTQVGLGLWKLGPRGGIQFSLFSPPEEQMKEEKLQDSLDALRERFGRSVIARGSALAAPRQAKPSFALPLFNQGTAPVRKILVETPRWGVSGEPMMI